MSRIDSDNLFLPCVLHFSPTGRGMYQRFLETWQGDADTRVGPRHGMPGVVGPGGSP